MGNGLERTYPVEEARPSAERGHERLSGAPEAIRRQPDSAVSALRSDPRTLAVVSEAMGAEKAASHEKGGRERNPDTYSENADVRAVQASLYEGLGIDVKTDTNNPFKKFSKGVIDGLVVGNAELVMRVREEGTEKFLSELKAQLTTMEGWKKIAESLGKSVMELFSGDAYKTGKSVAELWLVTSWAGAAGWWLKKIGGVAVKSAERAEAEALKATLRWTGKTLDVAGTVLQAPAKAVWKIGETAWKWARAIGEATWVSPVIRKGVNAWKEALERAWVAWTVRNTKEAVKNALWALGTVHFASSAEGFPKHPKVAEAGAVYPEGKPKTEAHESGTKRDSAETGGNAELLKESAAVYERYPDLKAHKEFLWELRNSDVLGEGMNGIIVRHPERNDVVVKIAKSGKVDDLAKEFEAIQSFHEALAEWKARFKGQLSENVHIPEVFRNPADHAGYFLMEKIEGQNLNTKFYREYYEKELGAKYPKDRLDAMTDGEFDKAMKDSWLEKVPTALAENDFSWRETLAALRKFYDQRLYGTELGNTLDFLEWTGHRHLDVANNPGNIMVDKQWRIFIIDFWRVEIKPTWR